VAPGLPTALSGSYLQATGFAGGYDFLQQNRNSPTLLTLFLKLKTSTSFAFLIEPPMPMPLLKDLSEPCAKKY